MLAYMDTPLLDPGGCVATSLTSKVMIFHLTPLHPHPPKCTQPDKESVC